MRSRIMVLNRLIPSLGDTSIIFDQNRAYRHFTLLLSPLC
jgi:hypothetical protein